MAEVKLSKRLTAIADMVNTEGPASAMSVQITRTSRSAF